MFDSREYEWSDITIVLAGGVVIAAREIQYTEKQEKELAYAKGNQPHTIQKGNFAYEGSLKVLQSDYEALVAKGKGTVLNIEADIICAYGNPVNGDVVLTDRISKLQFTEIKKGMKQGDKFMEVELPFIFLRLHNQIV
jgi:hypothetical protein